MKGISNTASEKGSINRSMELILQQIGQDKNMFHVSCVQLDMQMRYYLSEGLNDLKSSQCMSNCLANLSIHFALMCMQMKSNLKSFSRLSYNSFLVYFRLSSNQTVLFKFDKKINFQSSYIL